jgi:hypothetical protein
LLGLVLAFGLISCGGTAPGRKTEETWLGNDSATFRPDGGEDEFYAMQAGMSDDGDEVYAFLRLDLGADFLAGEITDARLFFKPMGGAPSPKTLRIAMVTGFWNSYFSSYDEAKALIDEKSAATVSLRGEPGGWLSLPLTDFVKAWLGGAAKNNGLALFGETAGELYRFASSFIDEGSEETRPYVKLSAAVGDRPLDYGKYPYAEAVPPGEGQSGGNCISYSLRDLNPILIENFGGGPDEMKRIYEEAEGAVSGSGDDALAEYFAELIAEYVRANAEGLRISQIRRIEDFDSKIDPAKEYRIVMRFGVNLPDEDVVDFTDPHSYDCHFRAQLNDGRWAQKFPTEASQIVPCSGPGISPGAFPWDSDYSPTPKTANYYTSKAIYFAVTKEGDELTRHRGETRDRAIEP